MRNPRDCSCGQILPTWKVCMLIGSSIELIYYLTIQSSLHVDWSIGWAHMSFGHSTELACKLVILSSLLVNGSFDCARMLFSHYVKLACKWVIRPSSFESHYVRVVLPSCFVDFKQTFMLGFQLGQTQLGAINYRQIF